jgi:hypothetical protein
VFDRDYYSGVSRQIRVTLFIIEERFVTLEATYDRLVLSTNEVWTRVNADEDVNARTPLPPTTAPPI